MPAPILATGAVENCSNPGTGGFTLLGPASGVRRRFRDDTRVATGKQVWYYATDGAQAEWGIGTLSVGQSGASDTLSRDTVTLTTGGNVSKLNFTGAIQVASVINGWSPALKDNAGIAYAGVNNDQPLLTTGAFQVIAASPPDQTGLAPMSSAAVALGSLQITALGPRLSVDFACDAYLDGASYSVQAGDSISVAGRVTLTDSTGAQVTFQDASADAIPNSRAKALVLFSWGSMITGASYTLTFLTYLQSTKSGSGVRYRTSGCFYRVMGF